MMDVTNQTLKEIGVENVPTLYIYNKCDLAGVPYPQVYGDDLWISAKEEKGLDELIDCIRKHIFSDYYTCEMIIPFHRGDIVSYLNDIASIISTEYEEDGTRLKVELKEADFKKFEEYVVK